MITYGDGKVLFEGYGKAFHIRYKGAIKITNSPDNLLLNASKNKILGVMLDGTDMPEELFSYIGELKIQSCTTLRDNALNLQMIKTQGIDYWEYDDEKWTTDESLWGTRDKTKISRHKVRFDSKKIVVNNNIKILPGQNYIYGDGTLVDSNELIHIMNDATIMSGGVHTKDSVQIYPPKDRSHLLTKVALEIRKAKNSSISSNSGDTREY